MFPGPSLVVVVNSVRQGGRSAGLLTTWAHASGVGLYALLVVLGLGVMINTSPLLFTALKIGGAVFLVYLGINAIRHSDRSEEAPSRPRSHRRSVAEGFFTAFLNPKLVIFFIALYSQYIRPEAPWSERLLMASTSFAMDGLWYSTVVFTLTTSVLPRPQTRSPWLGRLFGALLIGLGFQVLFQ